jgi:hypothetical protein
LASSASSSTNPPNPTTFSDLREISKKKPAEIAVAPDLDLDMAAIFLIQKTNVAHHSWVRHKRFLWRMLTWCAIEVLKFLWRM